MLSPAPRSQLDKAGVQSLSRARQWLVTCAATAVSIYALDAIATVAGVTLVASHLLDGLDHLSAMLFLASTYIAWGIGVSVTLKANLSLLETTGTSTNVLSKALYDLVKFRDGGLRLRRFAAAVGYVGTELAKEAPYYLGAFGAVLLVDSVSAVDALIFLGGANLGAAAYEYGLAHLTRAFLRQNSASTYASFEADWVPGDYLAEYYSAVEPDEQRTIAFFVDAIRQAPTDESVLLFGVGPTLHHVFLAANAASELHLADYLPVNLREIERWMERDAAAHDWRPFVRHTLVCEGLAAPTDQEISRREELTRSRISKLLTVDIRQPQPLGIGNTPTYGTVISAYCADSATGELATWQTYMQRIASLVRPGGTLIIAALRRSHGYHVGGKLFPSPNIDENDLRTVLEPCFSCNDISIEACELLGTDAKGYSSIVLVQAHRKLAMANGG